MTDGSERISSTPETELEIPDVSEEGIKTVFDEAVAHLMDAKIGYDWEPSEDFFKRKRELEDKAAKIGNVLDKVVPLEDTSWNTKISAEADERHHKLFHGWQDSDHDAEGVNAEEKIWNQNRA